jgi:hypothetical protein
VEERRGLAVSAFASATLDALVNAAASFSAAIQQQLEVVQSDPKPARFAESTIAYAKAKTAYFHALRVAMPELMSIAIRKEARPPAVDKFAAAFSVAGEKQAVRAEYETRVFMERFSGDLQLQKARTEFENAQKVEEASTWILTGSTLLWRVSLLAVIREPRLLHPYLPAALGRPVDEAGHRASTP